MNSNENIRQLDLEDMREIATDIVSDFELPIIEKLNERMKQFEKDGKVLIYVGQFLDIVCMCSLRLTQLFYKFSQHALSCNTIDFDVDDITEIHIKNFREMMNHEFKKGRENNGKCND